MHRNGYGFNADQQAAAAEDQEEQGTNPFDPKRVRISRRVGEGLDVRPVLASVAVCRPRRQWFVRVHPDPAMHIESFLLHREQDQQFYLVDRDLAPTLPGETVAMALFTAVNMSGGVFLWPIRLPDPNGRQHECHVTAHRAAELAQTEWVRISWDQALSNYGVVRARGQVPEPAWPDADLQKVLSVAFRDRYIDTLDHPVVRQLLGDFS
jgi:hypothetical protein